MQASTHELLVLLAGVLAGGVGVHLIANLFKRVFKLNSSAAIHTMVLALAAVASGAQYVEQIHSSLPPVILGISGTAIYGFSQIVYRYSNYAQDFLGKVRAYNASLTPATPAVAEPAVSAEPVSQPAETTTAEPAPASF